MDDLEAFPPPVPPKDTPERRSHQYEQSSASVSKRKRQDRYADVSELDVDYEEHTPKRHRLTPTQYDTSPPKQSTLRRKKGVNNLSTLNLRHEAERARRDEQGRESRFQEGSLTDKPSERPPSAFINFGTLEHMDTLMSDYHDGMPTPDQSVDDVDTSQLSTTSSGPSALYRFGQKLATSFRPVAIWNKLWNETKEDLTQRNLETERKRRQKEEAEKQYALMKHAGQIPTKRTSYANLGSISQRDSGIVMYDDRSSRQSSSLMLPHEEASARKDSSRAVGDAEGERTLRGRLHFKRPSLNNLRWDLKRTRSDLNLKADSSASLSPVKVDEEPVLQKSPSKSDLRRQHKLSKRVSDLEMKLLLARQELNDAIYEASPAPRLGRYERPAGAKKFVPGLLPSLPSERLLNAETMQNGGKHYEEETIRASRAGYPRRAADLFDNEEDSVDELADGRPATNGSQLYNEAVTPLAEDSSLGAPDQPVAVVGDSSEIEDDAVDNAIAKASLLIAEPVVDDSRRSSVRLSIDSTSYSLEPLYEEEEETTNIPLNGDPSKPTATATPARFGRFTRSMSPIKHDNVKPAAEEVVITRAAEAVKMHPGRRAHSRSPAKGKDFEWPDDVF